MNQLHINVRWRPEGAVLDISHDRSFRGEKTAVLAGAVSYIERNYLTVTVIKHSDRAESTRFWNFALLDIKSALGRVVSGLSAESDTPVTVDIGYQSIVISSSGEWPAVQVLAHPLVVSPRNKAEHVPLC